MRAVAPWNPDAPKQVVLTQWPDPEAGPGEVVLEVRATAINRADLLQVAGHYPPPPGETPVPGLEAAGVVASVGPGVKGWRPRDRAAALLAGGGRAERVATAATTPRVGDVVIRGHFESIEEGSTGKRVVLGFGSGNAELKTAVDVYQMKANGLRKLGSGAIDSGGGKTPGMLLPLAVTVATANPIGLVVGGAIKAGGEISGRDTIEGSAERTATQIATELRGAFKKQGWI